MAPNIFDSSSPIKRKLLEENSIKTILCQGQYYDVTDWINRHPGGRIINYYTESGEDATLAILQFHFRSQSKVNGVMKQLKIVGTSSSNDENGSTEDWKRAKRHADLTRDFLNLHEELKAQGFFEPSYWHLLYRILDILVLAMLGLYLMKSEGSFLWHWSGIFVFSISMGKCGWLQHEGGHRSLTGHRRIDGFIQAFAFGLAKGMSSSWWSSQHTKHHSMTQRLHRDVDLDTLPLLAFNSKVLEGSLKKSRGNFFIFNQAILFLTVDTFLVGLFWKFYLHPRYAYKKKNWLDLTFMTLSYFMLYYLGFWDYFACIWIISIYLFGNFSLSHTHLPVTSEPLHWVEYALLHTTNIDMTWCPWILDYWMGYLNSQIEHHLFPTMSQFRNRQVKEKVKALALKHGIPYYCSSYSEAVWKTLKNLHDVANHIKTA